MTPTEMLEHCRAAQAMQGRPNAQVGFVLPHTGNKLGRRKRLFPGGPLGEPAGFAGADGVMAFFEADKVIKAVEKLL